MTTAQISKQNLKEVFISYSHKDKNVANEIDNALQKYNIKVHRDVRDVSYRESFTKFMMKVRTSDFVLMIISDHFLKSKYCMFEVSEFLKDYNYDSRILPIVLENANIYDVEGVLEYIKYWKSKYDNLQSAVDGLSIEEITSVSKAAFQFREFSMLLGNFIEQIKDLNNKSYPEMVKNGFKDILGIIGIKEAIEDKSLDVIKEKEIFNEGRAIFLGNGGVGKTSLIKQMVFQTFETSSQSTEGIDITALSIKTEKLSKIIVNCWDFGGQEIYHSVHRLFLTDNALFIVVLDARSEAISSSVYYWLTTIKTVAKETPVIVVINKIDERNFDIDRKSLFNQFPNVVAIQKTSAYTKEGISELKELIGKYIQEFKIYGHEYPSSWHNLRLELERLNKPYISNIDFLGMCNRLNIDQSQSELASKYFHDIGVLIHFRDNFILRDFIILKPNWLTSSLYKLLDSNISKENKGEISNDELTSIWKEYPKKIHPQLLEIIKRFEICFHLPNSSKYIIPELLSINSPISSWDYTSSIKYQYSYHFLPTSIITRLIVRTHDIIKNNIYWKYGTLLQSGNSEALVYADMEQRKLFIYALGDSANGLLMMIRRELDVINSSYNELSFQEMVACNCSLCMTLKEPHFYKYDILLKYYTHNKSTIDCPVSLEDVNIKSILHPIQGTSKEDKEQLFQILSNVSQENDNEDSLLKKANEIIQIQPNFFGIGININEIIKSILKKKKQKFTCHLKITYPTKPFPIENVTNLKYENVKGVVSNNKCKIFILTNLHKIHIDLHKPSIQPDSNGNWFHDKVRLINKGYREVYAIAIPDDSVSKAEKILDNIRKGQVKIQIPNVLREIDIPFEISEPIVLIRNM